MSGTEVGYSQIRKNDNDFSFISAMFNLVGNNNFKQALLSTLCSDYDTSTTNIWRSLSAIGQELGSYFNESILNFIDNVSNVELCKTHDLDSLARMTGVKYSVFLNMQLFPNEVIKLIDVFSVKRECLLDAEKINGALSKFLLNSALLSNQVAVDECEQLQELRKRILQNDESGTLSDIWQSGISALDYIDDLFIDNFISSTYYSLLMSKVLQTYNDYLNTLIYKHLSSSILLSGFTLPNAYLSSIDDLKAEYNIQAFNGQEAADKIEDLQATLDDYLAYEQEVIQLEFKRRQEAFNSLQPLTRFKFYRERSTREYFKFIEQQYSQLDRLYSSAKTYQVDPTYIQLDNKSALYECLLDNDCNIKVHMVLSIAKLLLSITKKVRSIREDLKSLIQRNYMRGSYLLLQYMINEYLKTTVIPNINALSAVSTVDYLTPISVLFEDSRTGNSLIEYTDPTQYYNISTEIDTPADKCNERYWQNKNNASVEYPDDSTNLFKIHSILNTKNFVFAAEEIEFFYKKILRNNFIAANDGVKQQEYQRRHLSKFLDSVFDIGAETTYIDEAGYILTLIDGNIQPKTWIDLANSIASAYFDLSVYNISAYSLSGVVQDLISSLSSLFIDTKYTKFLEIKTSIFQDVAYLLTSNVSLNIEQTLNDIIALFNGLTTTFSNVVIAPMQSQYVALNINNFMLQIQALYSAATLQDTKILLNNISSQLIDISDDYKDAFDENKSARSAKLDTILFLSYDIYNDVVNVLSSISLQPVDDYGYLEDIAACYTTVLNENSSKLDTAQTLYDSQLCNALNAYDENWKSLALFSSVVSDYMQVDLSGDSIQTIAVSVYNELSIYDSILSSKEKLFYKYTGISAGEDPYFNIENHRHPSYLIHPFLSNFIEIDDMLYPIQNAIALVNENLESMISGHVNEYFDRDGYLIDIWKNPLNVNSDYMSRYEAAMHTNALNNEDPVFGYDGLFYPAALEYYMDNPEKLIAAVKQNLTTLKSNWYKGLNLTENEALFIGDLLDYFYNTIFAEVLEEYHDIYRYGIDLYGNLYILVKSYNHIEKYKDINSYEELLEVDLETRKNTPGVLWMKPKNHPIAFPAFALRMTIDENGEKTYTYAPESNIFISEDDNTSKMFIDLNVVDFVQINGLHYYSPAVYDFTVSKGKTLLLVNVKTKDGFSLPLVAKSQKAYDKTEERAVYMLNKDLRSENNYVESLIDYLTAKAEYNGYKFLKYFNIGLYPGAMYYKDIREDIGSEQPAYRFKGVWYNYSLNVQFEECRVEIQSENVVLDGLLKILQDADVCFDLCTNKELKDTCILKLAYLTDKIDAHLLSNYLNVVIPDYYALSDYIDTPSNCIVTKDFTVYKDAILEEVQSLRVYIPYTDHGFNPLHENVENNSADTLLPYHLFKKRGILKYLMIGKEKDRGIDFKFVLPIRMFDPYTVSADPRYAGESTSLMHYDNLSAADYMMQHFDESMLASKCLFIDVDGSIYDMYEFKQKMEDFSLGLRVDEEYVKFMKERNFSINDPYVDYAYLWRVNNSDGSENDIPEKYIYAYDETYSAEIKNEYDLNLFKSKDGYHHLSVSWYYANGSIGIDINSYWYTVRDEDNVFNRKHKFLNLPKSGDGGVLLEWKESDDEEDKLVAKYFIKNISDSKPRFLISAFYEDKDALADYNIVPETNYGLDKYVVEYDLQTADLVTEEGTTIVGES